MTKLEGALITGLSLIGGGASAIFFSSWDTAEAERDGGGETSRASSAAQLRQPQTGSGSGARNAVPLGRAPRVDTFELHRAAIDEAKEDALEVTEARLDHYLSELEDQAWERGQVTALEVEAGLAAIEHLHPNDHERIDEFSQRMATLSAELRSVEAGSQNPAEIQSELDQLYSEIRSREDGAAIQVYTEKASELPAQQREEALQRLEQIFDGP